MITLDHATHSYSDGTDRTYVSVTKVIDAVMKKSWDGVDPAVVDNARDRGERVESYCTDILRFGGCQIPAGERDDVEPRVEAFYAWYCINKPRLIAAQRVVSSETDGVAGCLDYLLEIDGKIAIVDLKCTASPEKAWPLQLGGYASYERSDRAAALHLNPTFAKGYIWREYEPMTVRSQWQSALNWYRTLVSLKVNVQ